MLGWGTVFADLCVLGGLYTAEAKPGRMTGTLSESYGLTMVLGWPRTFRHRTGPLAGELTLRTIGTLLKDQGDRWYVLLFSH